MPSKEILQSILKTKLRDDRVLIDVPRAELSRVKNMISGVRVYG